MQVERARYSASPVHSDAAAPPAGAYAFPPPRTASGDEHLHHRNSAPSPAPGEYQRPRTGEGNFSYAAPPPSSSHGHHPDERQRSMPEGYQQPRSMSIAGLNQMEEEYRSQAAAHARGAGVASPMPGPFGPGVRPGFTGGPVHELLANYAAYGTWEAPHERQHHHQQGPYAHYRPHGYPPAVAPPPGHPFARGPAYPAGPPPHPPHPLEWAKPRMSQDDSAIGTASSFSSRHFGSAPHTPRLPGHHPAYYSPYPGTAMGMVRSTSNQSGLSSLSESTAETSHYSSTDYEAHVNPSFLNQGFGQAGGDSGYYSSASAGEVHGVSNLRLDASPGRDRDDGGGHSMSTRNRSSSRITDKNATVRASSSRTVKASSSSSGAKAATFNTPDTKPKRRTASTIYHPSPAAMLAPEIFTPSAGAMAAQKGRKVPRFPGTNSPALPSDAEFAKMPTKRSRGRRPPSTPDLEVDVEDPNADPSEAQVEYCGRTKTGKIKKVFLCKVPGCGKCFKRSEHLKRHVRSIHTNEKPFQCQWPGCARFFSRHDNLNQHLRIHREPGMTDEDFSAALKECFDRRLREVERERALVMRRGGPALVAQEEEEYDEEEPQHQQKQEEEEADELAASGQEDDADGDVEDGGGSDYHP